MSATKKRAELKRLSAQTQQNIYDMLRLTDEILTDVEYVDHFGSEAAAMDDIEAKEFSHFGGRPSLGSMLRAYRKNPDLKTWKENKFNIVLMIDLANPKEERETVRVDWKAQAQTLEAELTNAKSTLAEQSRTISELRARDQEKAELIGELRGQIKVLEKYAPRGEMSMAR